jgi:hypothetical protein
MRLGGALASLLNAVASLLPQSARTPVRRISSQIGRGRSTVGQARVASSRAARLMPKRGARVVRARQAAAAREAAQGGGVRRSRAAALPWSQTPLVEPGQAITVELRVDPSRPYLPQQRTFRVVSRSADQDDAPPTVDEQALLIPGVPWFRRWAPYVLLYAAAATVSVVVFWLVRVGALGV